MKILNANALQIDLPNQAATDALAERLAGKTGQKDVIALHGDLGTGKTAFARAFIIARTGQLQEVPSPTFTLVQTYDAPGDHPGMPPFTLFHFDLYRISDPEEIFELGIEEAFSEGLSLIEWPDRLGGYLPTDRLDLHLRQGPTENSRIATLTGEGYWFARISEVLSGSSIH